MPVGAVSGSSQVIFLMLSIVLLELYLDEDAQAYQSGRQPSLQDLRDEFSKWYGKVSHKVPHRYRRAIRICGLGGNSDPALAKEAPQDLHEIVEHIAVLCSNDLR
ncbi:hypothetical protein CERZMDRAFT_90298 [Cercospora zeae-maydis SCOH1-5]|uniref:Uncharacterized protein n=1 Tax=Cercospora zeae-maydis SCOH1-5 TaxID=717836 RepID=A0A6A6FLJ1_9PEZI|nr:hypothetical protein CERZMDRAFT_90298 [Cercospora zeae-maydis SCOH1-5]